MIIMIIIMIIIMRRRRRILIMIIIIIRIMMMIIADACGELPPAPMFEGSDGNRLARPGRRIWIRGSAKRCAKEDDERQESGKKNEVMKL